MIYDVHKKPHNNLTDRELTVLKFIADGYEDKYSVHVISRLKRKDNQIFCIFAA